MRRFVSTRVLLYDCGCPPVCGGVGGWGLLVHVCAKYVCVCVPSMCVCVCAKYVCVCVYIHVLKLKLLVKLNYICM